MYSVYRDTLAHPDNLEFDSPAPYVHITQLKRLTLLTPYSPGHHMGQSLPAMSVEWNKAEHKKITPILR